MGRESGWPDHGVTPTGAIDARTGGRTLVRRDAAPAISPPLRHSYGTWLVSDGVPINDLQQLMGHEKASITLDLSVHRHKTLDSRVTELIDEF